MTDLAFRRGLIHTCTRERAGTARSASGEVTRDWANASTATISYCRLEQQTHRLATSNRGFVLLYQDVVLALPDADIREEDRLKLFKYRAGGTLDAGTFRVEQLRVRDDGRTKHHLTLNLERVK